MNVNQYSLTKSFTQQQFLQTPPFYIHENSHSFIHIAQNFPTALSLQQNMIIHFPRIDPGLFNQPIELRNEYLPRQQNLKYQEQISNVVESSQKNKGCYEISQKRGMECITKNEKLVLKEKICSKPYAHRNTESNIINQVFSFISNAKKSQATVLKQLKGDSEKARAYYQYMSMIKKLNNKYINRSFLVQISRLQKQSARYKILTKSKKRMEILTIDELRLIIRKMIMHYLKHKCTISVLTSSKLNKIFKKDNLKRRRQAIEHMILGLKDICKQEYQSEQQVQSQNNKVLESQNNKVLESQKSQIWQRSDECQQAFIKREQ